MFKIYLRSITIVFCLFLGLEAVAASQSHIYKQALKAIDKNDIIKFESLATKLRNHSLYPYIEYQRLRVKLKNVKKPKVDAFFKKYPDQPIATHLKSKWVKHLINEKRFSEAASYKAPAHAITLRCNILYAKLKIGVDVQYLPNKDLWLHGKSRPDACNPVFKYWKNKVYIGPIAYSKRVKKAIEAGNLKFAKKLGPNSNNAAKRLLASHLLKKLAIKKAKSFVAGSYASLNALPESVADNEVREWKARQFIHSGNWAKLKNEIEKMPKSQKNQDTWQYWLGRSYAKSGNKTIARELYKKAAKNSSFYGFLSADKLGEKYSICEKKKPDINKKNFYKKYPELKRAFKLKALDSDYFAGMEWNHAMRKMNDDEIVKAAILASEQGWHLKSILALGKSRRFQYYSVRFPKVYKDSIMRHAKARGLDPAYTYGIARTESALNPKAVSPVGARGLMQLMPATARRVAKKYRTAKATSSRLLQSDYNISLGTGYLQQMAQRWNRQLILMTASYNAGPHRGEKWIKILPHEADRFIATIPFNETRKYVIRVLDYTTMYNWVLGLPVKRIGGQISNIGSNKAFIGKKNATVGVVCRG